MHGRYSVLAHYLKVSLKNSRFLKIPKLHPQMCRSILFSSRKGENSTFFLIYYLKKAHPFGCASSLKEITPQYNRTAGTSSRRGCARCPSERGSAARSRCSKQRGSHRHPPSGCPRPRAASGSGRSYRRPWRRRWRHQIGRASCRERV